MPSVSTTPCDAALPSFAAAARTSERLFSLDALRGFDMLWILGGDVFINAMAAAFPTPSMQAVSRQFEHKAWEGFAFYDLIFPLFIFIVGVALVFSLTKLILTKGRAAALRRIIVRSVVLYLLGILHYGGLARQLTDVRLLGVLQRIAICYLMTALLFCFFRPRTLIAIAAVLLARIPTPAK